MTDISFIYNGSGHGIFPVYGPVIIIVRMYNRDSLSLNNMCIHIDITRHTAPRRIYGPIRDTIRVPCVYGTW